MSTRRNRTKPSPTKPAPIFADGARVTCGEHAGTVVSTEFTPDDFGRDIVWQMTTVRWDDGRTDEISPASLEAECTTDEERAAREYADAVAFARIHD
jgi:hypothetical protein